jgi:hypothetical protein
MWNIFPLPLYLTAFLLISSMGLATETVQGSVNGKQIQFGRIADRLLTDSYSAELRLNFAGNSTFNAKHFEMGLFGRSQCHSHFGSTDAVRWEKVPTGWELVIALDAFDWGTDPGFNQSLKNSQRHGATANFWITAPQRIAKARFVFSENKGDQIPVITNLTLSPSTWVVYVDEIKATFKANAPISRFECRLDDKSWSPCASPWETTDLSNGFHRFSVRAVSLAGRAGPVSSSWIYVYVPPPSVKITRVDPAASPIGITSKQLWFKPAADWGPNAYMECRLDDGPYKICASPTKYDRLSTGKHVVEIRQVLKQRWWFPGDWYYDYFYVGSPAIHRWVVDSEPLQLSWVKTPAERSNASEFVFEFQANRTAETKCAADGNAAVACTSPFKATSLAEGAHSVRVSGWVNGAEAASIDYRFIVDRTAPELVWTNLDPNRSPSSKTSFSGQLSVSEAATLQCNFDGKLLASCPNPFTLEPLSDGAHSITVVATDTAGNAAKISHDWIVDSQSPKLVASLVEPLVSPASSKNAKLEFSSDEAAQFSCSLDGQPAAECSSPWTLSDLGEGEHAVVITAMDAAGNSSDQLTLNWMVDTIPPKITWYDRTPGEARSASRSFSIHIEANEVVQYICRLNGGQKEECSGDLVINGLMDGEHRFEVYAVDAAKNVSETHVETWEVAATAITSIDKAEPADKITTQSSIEFAFSSAGAASFECKLDAGAWSACTSLQSYTALKDGAHLFEVRALNALAEYGPAVSWSWSVDATAPVLSVTQFLPATSLTAETSASAVLSSTEAGVFYCKLNAQAAAPCAAQWSVGGLADGEHHAEFYSEDALGNRSAIVTKDWVVDTVVPVISWSGFAPSESPTARQEVSATFTGNKKSLSFTCELDGKASECAQSFSQSGLTEGTHLLTVVARDALGRNSNKLSRIWAIDVTAPVVTLGAATPAKSVTSETTISLAFAASETSKFQCALDGAAAVQCASPVAYSGLNEGAHSIAITATDLAGNKSETKHYAWTIDTTPPGVTISSTSPSFSPTASTSMSISFTMSADATSAQCSFDGGAFSACTSPWRRTGLADGAHQVEMVATDNAGLESARVKYSWEVRTTPVVVENVAVTLVSTNSATISWTTNLPANSQVEFGSGAIDQASSLLPEAVTAHSVTLTGLAPNTLYRARAVSRDRDGRRSESTIVSFRTLR